MTERLYMLIAAAMITMWLGNVWRMMTNSRTEDKIQSLLLAVVCMTMAIEAIYSLIVL